MYTLGGHIIKGVVKKADSKMLGIEHETGFFVVYTRTIVSLFMRKDGT